MKYKLFILLFSFFLFNGCFILEYPQLKQENQNLKFKVSLMEKNYKNLNEFYKKQVSSLKSIIADLTNKLEEEKTSSFQKINNLKDLYQHKEYEYEQKIKKLQSSISEKSNQISLLSQKLRETISKLNELKKENELLLSQIKAFKENIENLKAEKEKSVKFYSQKLKKLEEKLFNLDSENKKLLLELKSFKQQLIEKEKILKKFEEKSQIKSDITQEEEFYKIYSTIYKKLNGKNIKVTFSKEPLSIRIRIKGNNLFLLGKATINNNAKPLLKKIGKVLKNYDKKALFIIEGHTDSLPLKNAPFPSNWELSAVRATNVLKYLVKFCKIRSSNIVAMACSSYHPCSNKIEENRRIEIVILPLNSYKFY